MATLRERCSWEDLGVVAGEGEYRVSGVGLVYVVGRDIETAQRLAGNPTLELVCTSAAKDIVPLYRIARFIPD